MGDIQAGRSERWIMHVDLDAFFASVEELLDPSLRGKAIIVGGAPDQRGVVSSASYAARGYGVRSAMPVAQALRLCPHAIVVRGHYGDYGAYSCKVMDILQGVTPIVEQLSIDEAFLDVTGCERLWGPVPEMGAMIQRKVLEVCGLPVSLGIASSKLVAKIACDQGKPKGLVLVPHGQEQTFLAPLAIEKLWGVGPVTGTRLRECGIEHIGDLLSWDCPALERAFGEMGTFLYRSARGIDGRPVSVSHERHSISQERTFAVDTGDRAELLRLLLRMSDHLAARLRERHVVAQTVKIKMRSPAFETVTRQARLAQPTDQAPDIYAQAISLFEAHFKQGRRLRLLGLGVSGLIEQGGYQLDLFDQRDQRQIRLSQTLDDIRSRFGEQAIRRASLVRKAKRQPPSPDHKES